MPSAITVFGTAVQPIAKEWKFDIDENNGCSGVRKYMDSAAFIDGTAVELPSIGDAWSDKWPDCRVERIEINWLSDDPNCQQVYTLYYKTTKIDTQALINEGEPEPIPDDLVVSLETSSEFISVQPPKDANGNLSDTGFVWSFDGVKVDQPIYFVVNTTTLKVQRMIVDLNEFINASWDCIGKVNKYICMGAEPGTLLYTGFSTPVPVRSETGTIKWRCDLNFVHRTVTGETEPEEGEIDADGWNYVLRENRASVDDPWWQKPERFTDDVINYLYEFADFEDDEDLDRNLFKAGAESIDLLDVTQIPLK